MYVVTRGLGKRWWPLAMLFCRRWVMGTMPAFQVNQLVQIVREVGGPTRRWPHHKAISL